MDYLIIDFETYFDDSYSLRRMPTHEYIRDERFRALGLAYWRSTFPTDTPGWAEGPQIKAMLDSLPYDVPWVAHNALFDASVLQERFRKPYQRRPKLWLDTMLMARYCIGQGILPPDLTVSLAALAEHFGLEAKGDTAGAVAAGGEALAEYARHDIYLTREILHRLLPHVPRSALLEIDRTIRMGAEPVLQIDRALCQQELDESEMDPELKKAVGSNAKFAALLEAKGVTPATKISPATNKETYAFAKTDRFMQGLLVHDDPVVRFLAKARVQSKSNLRRTRAQRFMRTGNPLPVPLLYSAAHTGRPGGQDGLNLLNLPRGGRLRQAIHAPEGHTLVICDSSQVEVRVLGWLAGDDTLLADCLRGDEGGPDVYVTYAAEEMFRKPAEEVTDEERTLSKPPVLACGYGQRERGLMAYAESMGIAMSRAQAERGVGGYHRRYRGVVRYWDRAMDEIRRTERQELPSGRRLTYPNLRWEGRELLYDRPLIFSKLRKGQRDTRRVWHGLAVENATQATAWDIVSWQIQQLHARWKVVLTPYDEVVLCVPEAEAEDALAEALHWFSEVPEWAKGLPLRGEAIISKDYGASP